MAKVAISVEGLSKRYRIYRRRHQTLKEVIARRSRGEWEDFWALRDVSFQVRRGQFLGVIGNNGSGKSTLLKVLAGILRPNRGRVLIDGRVSSLLELGAGFHSEYTGRENVYLYGTLLGLRRREVERKYDSIVDFCELGDFMEVPVKNYSSGMYVRLGFAVAVHLDPEILLVDEVLAVGDANFQQKCYQHLHTLRARGCTIVLVSHATDVVTRFCERAIWIDRGRLMADGASHQVVQAYLDAVASGAAPGRGHVVDGTAGDAEVRIEGLRLLDAGGAEIREIETGAPMRVEVAYSARAAQASLEVALTVFRADGVRCADALWEDCSLPAGEGLLIVDFPAFNLQGGSYDLSLSIYDKRRRFFHDFEERSHPFTVRDEQGTGAVAWLEHRWSVSPGNRSGPQGRLSRAQAP